MDRSRSLPIITDMISEGKERSGRGQHLAIMTELYIYRQGVVGRRAMTLTLGN